ncbi:MAG: ribosomal protein S18-alanine N-acetyltransferase [Alphaproteobacteria bacterium]|nr:ribosomal protein S18-alanine N-acetyltransferase [Alphaproteobacteria bacterium]
MDAVVPAAVVPAAVVPASIADADALSTVEAEVFGANCWSPAAVRGSLERRDAVAFVARDADGTVLGGAWGWAAGGVGELLRVAVRPSARRQGLGRRLILALAGQCAATGADELMLEVRADNDGAIALYTQLGMQPVGRRPRYYDDGCDAVLMSAPLPLLP